MMRLNCWSGPRNVSTALMYAFRERADTRVVDEPLYAAYLAATDAVHPDGDGIAETLETDPNVVVRDVILGPSDRPILFCKQMAHHLTPDVDLAFLDACTNFLLIRDPAEVLRSLPKQVQDPQMRDVGLQRQVELLADLRARGQDPPIVDARELLLDPPGVLQQLCGRLGIDWDPAMLSWPAGPKPEDGMWAPDWYHNVHRSTGFGPYTPKDEPVADELGALLAECRPLYDQLYADALRA